VVSLYRDHARVSGVSVLQVNIMIVLQITAVSRSEERRRCGRRA
jgi:hypothetical protein